MHFFINNLLNIIAHKSFNFILIFEKTNLIIQAKLLFALFVLCKYMIVHGTRYFKKLYFNILIYFCLIFYFINFHIF